MRGRVREDSILKSGNSATPAGVAALLTFYNFISRIYLPGREDYYGPLVLLVLIYKQHEKKLEYIHIKASLFSFNEIIVIDSISTFQ